MLTKDALYHFALGETKIPVVVEEPPVCVILNPRQSIVTFGESTFMQAFHELPNCEALFDELPILPTMLLFNVKLEGVEIAEHICKTFACFLPVEFPGPSVEFTNAA